MRPIVYNGAETGNDEAQWLTKFEEKDALKTAYEEDGTYLMGIKPGKSTWQGEYNRCRVLSPQHIHVFYSMYKQHAPESAAGMGDTPDTDGAKLNFPQKHVDIVSTTSGNEEVIFLPGPDTYALQWHLETKLGYTYSELNGLRGHVQAKATVDMPALHALLDKYGWTYEDCADN